MWGLRLWISNQIVFLNTFNIFSFNIRSAMVSETLFKSFSYFLVAQKLFFVIFRATLLTF